MPSIESIRDELLRRLRGDHTPSSASATHMPRQSAPPNSPHVRIIPLAQPRGRSEYGAGVGGAGRDVGFPRPMTRPGGDPPPEHPGGEGVHHHYHAHVHHYHFYGASPNAPTAPLPVPPPPLQVPVRVDWPPLPRRSGCVVLFLVLLGALLMCMLMSMGFALLGQLATLH